jgi:hypothetical protein
MTSQRRIGVDFDNTIISYDNVFRTLAKQSGLIEPGFIGGKQAVRDAIRILPDGERAWQRLQGHVYGKGVSGAAMLTGVREFLRRCRTERCPIAVVSHKTEYGHDDPDRVNLREAAFGWMAAQGLFDGDFGVARNNVYFESTRADKLRRIATLGLTHFVDDLEEVLTDPGFPQNTFRILLSAGERPNAAPYFVCATWQEVEDQVFGGADL